MVRFDNVSIGYGSSLPVLRDMNFEIESGSFQFLTGPSGSGKTSFLSLLLMQLSPVSGTLHLFGKNTNVLSRNERPLLRQRIGVVFQDFRLLSHLTVYENVALPLVVRGIPESSYRSDVIDLLDWVGLEDRLHDYPIELSGGQQQSAAIARAVVNRPDLLLADEPTGNLDSDLSRRVLRLFVELHRGGTSVIIATHDSSLMNQYSSRCFVLSQGHLQIHG